VLIGKNRHLRRRAVIGLLLAASLTLLTLSFRQGSQGAIGAIQRGALAVTAPLSSATTRVTQPFVDGWNWTGGLIDARSENAQLKRELEQARATNVQLQQALDDNAQYQALLNFTHNSQVASQYDFVGGSVIQQAGNIYSQTITLNVGSDDGIAVNDPVVAPAGDSDVYAGLVGRVSAVTGSACSVELLLDPDYAASARILTTTVRGILLPNSSDPGVLALRGVSQDEDVKTGGVVVTAGIQSRQGLQSLLPPGIPIGQVTSVSQSDLNEATKTIQVTPFVDLQSLDHVLVLKVHGG
jgi:rod shape-determining protein MreC